MTDDTTQPAAYGPGRRLALDLSSVLVAAVVMVTVLVLLEPSVGRLGIQLVEGDPITIRELLPIAWAIVIGQVAITLAVLREQSPEGDDVE